MKRAKVYAVLAGIALTGAGAIPALVHAGETPDGAAPESTDDSATVWDKTRDVSGAAWEATREGSARAWDKTKAVSGTAWEATREGSARAWDKTRAVSGDAWEATRGMVQGEEATGADAAAGVHQEPPATPGPAP